jgi:putative ABC transport system permease protein
MRSRLRRLLLRLLSVVRSGTADRELAREVEAHLALLRDDFERRGMTPVEARTAAVRTLGGTARVGDLHRDERSFSWLDDAVRDLHYARRMLARTPGATAVAVLTIGLATGATTAIFSIVNSVLLQPLPFPASERLVQIYGRLWGVLPGDTGPDPMTGPVGALEHEAFAAGSTTLDGVAGYNLTVRHLRDAQESERLRTVEAERSLFRLLGVAPVLGRTLRDDDPLDVAVMSSALWERRFNRSPAVLGRSIALEEHTFTIVGVMPEWFQFPYAAGGTLPGTIVESRIDLWVPLAPPRLGTGELRRGRVSVVAKMKPGVSLRAAQAELDAIAARLRERHPDPQRTYQARIAPLTEVIVAPVRRSLWMLFAAVGLVLVAACANVANLLLVRLMLRRREVVTRAALGASGGRLLRQFLTESLLLSLAGGVLGALIARWCTNVLATLVANRLPRAHEIALDWVAFAFLLTCCVAVAIAFGLGPAVSAARLPIHDVAKEGAGHSTAGRNFGRLRDGLVVVEVALAFVLAAGAAQVMREIARLGNVPTGMRTENVLTLHVTPRVPPQDYYAIERAVARLPGVDAAGFIQLVPLQNWGWEADFSIQGRAPQGRPRAGLRYVTPGYFDALGIPVLRGRGFADSDTADAPRVILVNDALARAYFPGEDPVGRELDRGRIVGVVGDVRQVRLDRPAEPEIYYPVAQNVAMTSESGMSLLVRSATAPERMTAAIRAAVRSVNPHLAIFNVRAMRHVVADSLWELNLYRWSIGLFAALTLVIAAIGLYAVISQGVSSRTREFALRLALGSPWDRLARSVIARAAGLAAAGLAIGGLAAYLSAPWLQQLPSPIALDWAGFAAAGAMLVTIAVVASAVPARRAARVDPAAALRQD